MANITYRESTNAAIPDITVAKLAPLTNIEVDANFKSLNDDIQTRAVAATVTNALSLKAATESPTFTGTVVLPSSTSIGTITNVELGYLDGVTSSIQTQLGEKAFVDNPTFTGTVVLPSSTSIGTITNIELGYLDGVTSSIQTQLGEKAALESPTFTGTVVLPSSTSIGTITNVELGYLDGVTSSVQTQINTISSTAASDSLAFAIALG